MRVYSGGDSSLITHVAVDSDGSLRGFVEASLRSRADGCTTQPVGYVEGIFVQPEFRRRGIARALIDAAEQWATSNGCVEFASDCRIENEASIHFHRSLGFDIAKRLVHFRRAISKEFENAKIAPKPTLYIFSGLPGAGKTTLSHRLAKERKAVHLRIDTIEQALRDICKIDVQAEGYRLAYRIAADNLRLGLNVIADSCNPIELTRDEWENVARQVQARFVNIEIICSDKREHRERIEHRQSDVVVRWDEVERREYHSWTRERIAIETAGRTEAGCFDELLSRLAVAEKK